ncbi:MAG: membrane protein insertase YidC [Ferruginibacter sp.]
MDKNTVIGFLLIGALLIAMMFINNRGKQAFEAENKRIADSIALLKPKVNPAIVKLDSLKAESMKIAAGKGGFIDTGIIEKTVMLENEVFKIMFTNKGAMPKVVELKKYLYLEGGRVVLQKGSFNKISYSVNSSEHTTSLTENLLFTASPIVQNTDKSQSVSFVSQDTSGRKLTHTYTIKPDDYMVDLNITIDGSDRLFNQNTVGLLWQTEGVQAEKDNSYERSQTNIAYVENGDFDFEHIGSGDDMNFSKPVDWIALKQQFFATALLAKNKFKSATTTWMVPADSNKIIARAVTNAKIDVGNGNRTVIPLQLYYGPSDYNILKKYNNQMEDIVPYGSGIFAFVKYINRYFLLPVFDFLQKNVASMGMVILLLTLLIRLITSPILYKSYLSGAKMKVLKPEVDALKEKYKDPKTGVLDQQAFSVEQMKLWRTAGVSPLGGCLPALLQIPIFMSLYYFFQSNIDLRGKSFLWAPDLAAYDSIAQLPFSIPFYGDHVSLFTLTAVITSLIISIYSMSQMQDNSNPLMKYMPYIFPVLLLGVFNNLPAALTWYYTVSNTITLILQIVIQKYIINNEKILIQIGENRKKPVKKSKLQERMEAMQATQKKLQEVKNKTAKK